MTGQAANSTQQWHSAILEVQGQHLRVAVHAGDHDRPPLLLCNGLGASLEMLEPLVDYLPGQGMLAFDVPGTGGSSPSPEPLRMDGLAHVVMAMVSHLGFPVVDVLGVSWGGFLAQQLAHQFPTRIRKLILAATGAGGAAIPGRLSSMAALANPRRYHDPQHLVEIAPRIYGGAFRKNPELAQRYFSDARPPSTTGYYGQLIATLGWQSILWLHRLRQPTLILAGSDDPLCPLINARILAARIPNARLHVFDDGHLFLLTSAASVAPLIHDFLLEAI
jgi:poly(3-hydroxyoctanoate) depolymerase